MFSRVWWLSTFERAGKTFLQAYLLFWFATAGIVDFSNVNTSEVFDSLFTWNNVKAGVVGVVLSFASSILTTPAGPGNGPSAVVTETTPTSPSVS